MKKIFPTIVVRPQVHAPSLRMITTFGVYKFLSNVSGQVVFQLDRFLIGMFRTVGEVTYYTVPWILANQIVPLVVNITAAAFPRMSVLYGARDQAALTRTYVDLSRLVLVLAFPVSAYLMIYGRNVLSLWVGSPTADHSTATLAVLATAMLLAAAGGMATVFNEATGMPQLTTLFAAISAGINLGAALVLIPRLGALGAACALLINTGVQVPIFLHVTHRRLDFESGKYLSLVVLKPLLAALVPAMFLVALHTTTSLLALLLVTLGYLVLYAASAYVVALKPAEREMVVNSIKNFFKVEKVYGEPKAL